MSELQPARSIDRELFDQLPAQVSTLFTFVALGALALVWMVQPESAFSQGALQGSDDAVMCRAVPAHTSNAGAGNALQGVTGRSVVISPDGGVSGVR